VDSVVGRKTRVQQRLGTLEGIDVTLASLIHYNRGRRRRGRLCRIRFFGRESSVGASNMEWSGADTISRSIEQAVAELLD